MRLSLHFCNWHCRISYFMIGLISSIIGLSLLSPTLYAIEFSAEDIIYQQDYNDGRGDYIITPPIRWVLINVQNIDTPIPSSQPYSVLF